ncbi:TPA: hypothetical protein ACS7XE_003697, partial [Providencia alcalifaciens]
KKNPKRINDSKMLDKCSCFGLSLYATQEQAETVFSELEKTFKKARKSIGTHVSRGELTTSDGVVTDIDDKGHFDFHPYLGIDIKTKFALIREIPCLS